MSRQPIDYAFAALEIAEANHAMYLFREIVERLKRGEKGNIAEMTRYALHAYERLGLALKSAGVEKP